MFFGLSVCPLDYSKSCEWILMKFLEGWGIARGPTDYILVTIQVTIRIPEFFKGCV